MKYWQLKVENPAGGHEVFDLRTHQQIYIGDAKTNDLCIETGLIPSKFKVLRTNLWGRPELNLTDDVATHLNGKVTKKTNWKKKLHSGSKYSVQGNCEWKIDGYKFELSEHEWISLTSSSSHFDDVNMKDWGRSVVIAMGLHAILLLLIGLWGFMYRSSKPETTQAKYEYTKVHIERADKIFANEPDLMVPADATKEVVQTKEEAEQAAKAEEAKKQTPEKQMLVAQAPKKAKNSQLAASSKKAEKTPDVNSLGILALQATASAKTANIDVQTLAHGRSSHDAVAQKEKISVSLGLAPTESIMLADAEREQVAKLEGISVATYEGGMGEKVLKGEFKGSSIKLVKREVEVRGGLDPSIIRQIIEERLPEVRYCYETALLQQSNLSGKIMAQWTIQSDGTVSNLKSDSDEIKSNVLHPCIKQQIKAWKFPTPKGGGIVHVKYPFLFSPLGG